MLKTYQANAAAAQLAVDKCTRQINTFSLMRLVVFALVVVSVYISLQFGGFGLLAGLSALLLFAFLWLVSRQSRYEEQRNYFVALKKVNNNEIDSILNQGNIYSNGVTYSDDTHHYTADLDIFGPASLYQLTNRAATAIGNHVLAGWFKAPSGKNEILERQEAIKELGTKHNWKLDLQARLLFAKDTGEAQFKDLFIYLATPITLQGEKWLRTYIKTAPWLLGAAIISIGFWTYGGAATFLIALFNLCLNLYHASVMAKSGAVADKVGKTLQQYAGLFKSIENEPWQSGQCRTLAHQLVEKQTSKNINELGRLLNNLSVNLIMVVGFLLNIFMLWSLKQIIAIEDWKRSNRASIAFAFDVLGEFEALLGLAGLRINYPQWCFPLIADGDAYTYKATQLAHPLINNPGRVANDFELSDTFKIDIITGSNMAGKSTFLRTLGINAVLALSGAPVCAESMSISIVKLFTYMRIKDSLSESTSTFKAELDRLQMLLKAVDKHDKIYFLVDEMLRGTNSVDKYLGSKAVIEQLIKKGGVGLVATHDIQIAKLEDDYPDYIRNFYFDIQVIDGEMLFDYKIKHGACKTFNASMLLKRIGIEVAK